MLLQAGHQLDEIARTEAVVELVREDALPGVAAGARGTGQGEQVGAASHPGGRPALDRRGADLLVALPAKQLAEARDLLFVDDLEGLWSYIAAGDPGAAGRDHDIDVRIGDPGSELRGDRLELVADDAARGDAVPGRGRQLSQGIAGAVVGLAAGVRYGQ